MKKFFLSLVGLITALFGSAQTPAATTVKHPDYAANGVIYEVNVRQFSPEGTFKAVEAQLPRLKDLGVDILWLMPIHPISEDGRKGTLGSYYAVKDYKAVNPEFGSMQDFKDLVNAAHKQGMKLIIDWVPNHSGRDNAWVKAHPDWYARNDKGEMFGPYDWTDVYKFDYSNPEMRRGMTDAMLFWIDEADIDGFRCDVAGEVPTDFWNELRPKLDAKKTVFMLAESPKADLAEHAFDMLYNWPMKDLFSAIAATQGQYTFKDAQGNVRTFPETHADAIYKRLAEEASAYPAGTIQMNMITNHDLNSWEGTEFERLGRLQGAFAVLMYTLPGMPLIYTGQEVGLNRALEFFENDTAPDWNANPDTKRFYQTLNSLRHNSKDLAAGLGGAELKPIATLSPDVLAFSRGDVLTIVNLSSQEQKLFDKAPDVSGMHDIFTGTTSIPATLPSGGYLVFTK